MNSEKFPGKPYSPIMARLARLATAVHVSLYRLSGGKIAGRAQNMPVLLLTTTGRKSGKQHTTPLIYLTDGNSIFIVASNGGQGKLPNWWLNMRKSKEACIEIGSKQFQVRVQEAVSDERQRLWSLAVASFPGYAKYQQRTPYPIPLVILRPLA
ncbi:hypothetical protein KSC_101290 [Ktedonobacter sp. SOSP1-52]|uniref:nitroreductase family deazaflavin-dependent oxidoreductase n=1 Tax=Ktedonobacter sp. SOSP1-52 TaxID=2778366 RepID=UPI0019154353|nr:nitroreductase family deazaflavin-dependent oxidoreductase [Ktedonobacter sp. SOSP1-52]GHO71237.1 hypothetical protein KSC_101290 [Ktedonobacter sp. SOSP1-52]